MSAGKRVVITGVSRGLGEAMAIESARLGHTVAGCSRTDPAALRHQLGAPHHFATVDVTKDSAVRVWAEEILKLGVPDLLLNNAGIVNHNAPLWEVSAEEFSAVIDINLKGVANVIRHFTPAMIQAGRGVIVNFSSGWGRSTSPEVAPYCATKWGIEGLTQALAQELPAGLAAIPLNPGIINTEMLRSCFGSAAGSYPEAGEWARNVVPFLLKLGPRDNGKPLTAPG